MNFWLLLTYAATLNGVSKGQSVVNNGQPSDEKQHLAGLLNNVVHHLYKQEQQTRNLVQVRVFEQKISGEFDRQQEVIIRRNQTAGRLQETRDQQSEHFNRTLSHQQGSLQHVANSILQQLELAFLCSSIPWPTVGNATQSIKLTSNETIITYTCDVDYVFGAGLTTRSTTCNGSHWTPVDDNCISRIEQQSNVKAANAGRLLRSLMFVGQVVRPVLTHVIRGLETVFALATLNNQLFVTRFNSPIAVYDTTTFEWIRNITVAGADIFLYGLAPCSNGDCLYVSDFYKEQVYKLNLSPLPGSGIAVTTTKWTVVSNPRGLSVNRQHNLLVALTVAESIAEYTPSGSLVRETRDNNLLAHAVEHVVNSTFVVSRFGFVHGVASISVDGRVIHSYGSTTPGSGPGQMNNPRSLAVDRNGYVLVADMNNDRILVLNPTLSDARTLPLPTDASGQPLKGPVGLWLDESRGRLYVGEGGPPFRVLIYDNVFNVGTLFKP